MKNLIVLKNLNIPNRCLMTSSQKCKHISPYDNPMPRDSEVDNVIKKTSWQDVGVKGGKKDKDIRIIQSDDSLISNPIKAKYLANTKLRSFYVQIKSKGFARELKPYRPPENLKEQFDQICLDLFGKPANDQVLQYELNDPVMKYKLITRCIQEFNHELPNSDLHLVTNVNNVLTFYATPVKGVNTFDALANSNKLPKNLHLITNTVKFNPDTDTFFGGLDAFPKKAIIEDGLKLKKKYDNFKAKIFWPDV